MTASTGFGRTLPDEGDDPADGAEEEEDGEDLVGKDEPAWLKDVDGNMLVGIRKCLEDA